MASSKRAPKPNVALRRARRDLEHRRRERSFLWWFWGGWLGLLFASVANRDEHAQQARLGARHRRRHRESPTDTESDEAPQDARQALADVAPRARDRAERDVLRRSARRRHLIRTVAVVGGILVLYLAWMVVRFQLRR